MTETRAERMAWAKARALACVDRGDLESAFASFASDLRKHPETERAVEIVAMVGMPLMLMGQLASPDQMREWIEGFA